MSERIIANSAFPCKQEICALLTIKLVPISNGGTGGQQMTEQEKNIRAHLLDGGTSVSNVGARLLLNELDSARALAKRQKKAMEYARSVIKESSYFLKETERNQLMAGYDKQIAAILEEPK